MLDFAKLRVSIIEGIEARMAPRNKRAVTARVVRRLIPGASPPKFTPTARIHGDTDRSDEQPSSLSRRDLGGRNLWKWGPGERGAIVLFNCDDSDGPVANNLQSANFVLTRRDAADAMVNGPLDLKDLAPVRVLRSELRKGWRARLTASDPALVRLFEGAPPHSRVLDASKPTYDFDDLRRGDVLFLMEATRFPDVSDPARPRVYVDLILEILDERGRAMARDEARFRIAPWVMAWNGRPALEVYARRITTGPHPNGDFVDALASILTAPDVGVKFQVITANYVGAKDDRWVQDWMEIGVSRIRNRGHTVALANNRAPVKSFAGSFPADLIGPGFGYMDAGGGGWLNGDSFGNIEVTPPVGPPLTIPRPSVPADLPFGRIYYGSADGVTASLRSFLESQRVQHPFQIDTSWLVVGHADEVVTFVPAERSAVPSDPSRRFRMLVASPLRALQLLSAVPRETMLLTERLDEHGQPLFGAVLTLWGPVPITVVRDILDNADLVAYNMLAQKRIDGVVQTFRAEVGLQLDEIKPVPVLFRDEDETWRPGDPLQARALTCNMINCLTVVPVPSPSAPPDHQRPVIVVPVPFGPIHAGKDVFQDDLVAYLQSIGNRVRTIDSWYSCHVVGGDVHCVTGVRRRQRDDVHWWEMSERE